MDCVGWERGGVADKRVGCCCISRILFCSSLMLDMTNLWVFAVFLVFDMILRSFSAWIGLGVSSFHYQCFHPRTQLLWIYIFSSCGEILDSFGAEGSDWLSRSVLDLWLLASPIWLRSLRLLKLKNQVIATQKPWFIKLKDVSDSYFSKICLKQWVGFLPLRWGDEPWHTRTCARREKRPLCPFTLIMK